MSDIVERDYLRYAEDLLPTQFRFAENSKKLLSIFLEEDQLFQDELMKLFAQGGDVDTATGYQLELIGKLSGVERTIEDDDVYREQIKFQRSVDNGSGTTPEVLSFVKQLTGVDGVKLFPHYPASFSVQVKGGDSVPKDIAIMVDKVSLAGVNAHTVIHLKNGVGVVPAEDNQLDNYNSFTESYDPIPEGEYGWSSVLPEDSFLEDNPDSVRGLLPESYNSRNYV